MGVTTVAITNMEYTSGVTSRHKSRKKLHEVCDIVIDNCGDFEDSSMLLPGMKQKIGPTSSAVGCTIVNMIVIRTVEHLMEKGNRTAHFPQRQRGRRRRIQQCPL